MNNCSRCSILLQEGNHYINRLICKSCYKQQGSTWRINNPKLHKEGNKSWQDLNKEKVKLRNGKYYVANKERILTLNKEYRDANKESVRTKIKEWKALHKADNLSKIKSQYKQDINFRLRRLLRGRLGCAVNGNYKSGSAVNDLGCSIVELKQHLESKFQLGMTWNNHGQFGWHIDHIKPLSKFNLSDSQQLKQACHYTNLQPLWWQDNLSKGDKGGVINTSNIPNRALREAEVGMVWMEQISGATGSIEVPRYATFRVRATGASTVTVDGTLAATMSTGEIMIFNAGVGLTGSSTKKTVTVAIGAVAAFVQVAAMVEPIANVNVTQYAPDQTN